MNDFGLLVGRFLSSFPTLSNEQLSELMLDSSGRLIISGRWLEDSAHTSGDAGISVLAVRNDSDTSLVDTDGDYAPLQVNAQGRLKVDAELDVDFDFVYAEDSAHTSGDLGGFVLGVRNDSYAAQTSADGDYGAFNIDSAGRVGIRGSYAEDSAASSGDSLVSVGSVRQDTLAASSSADGDYQHIKSNAKGEVYVIDTDANTALSAIQTSVANIDIDTSSIITELQSANTSLDAIESDADQIRIDTTAIRTEIESITHDEDSPHVSGHAGVMPLAVRNDAGTALAADGDYIPFTTDSTGALRVNANTTPGSEQYSVTDALAAGGDGLVTITAAATPWVTVASLAHTSGTAYVYGYQWACDQNADARLVTDDGSDTVVYKRSLNSSSSPSWAEHWAESGRIEIAGSAGLEIRLQVKKRSTTGGNANGTGSIHIRV